MKRAVVIAMLLLTVIGASAQDVSKQSERKKRLMEEITFIDNQLKSLTSKQKATTQQLGLIQKKVENRRTILSDIDRQIKDADSRINSKNIVIRKMQQDLDTLTAYYEKLVYNSYKNRDTKVWFMYVLGSENIGQGYRRLAYLKNLSNVVNEQGHKIQVKKAMLEQEKAELNEIKASAQKVRAERAEEYAKLLSEEQQSQKTIKALSKSESQYRKELDKKRQEVEKLNKEIERILSSTVAKQKKDKTEVDEKLSGEFAQNKGKLPWPVKQGVVSEKFGKQVHPVYKNIKLPDNNGITIATTRGAQVFSVFEGVVKQIIVMPGYNQCVLVQHGSYFTFYCKLQKVSVKVGQKVTTGQALGTLETSGDGSALHFQIWKGTEKQNPESWLK
jgi:Membrane-bound metallopeptidase